MLSALRPVWPYLAAGALAYVLLTLALAPWLGRRLRDAAPPVAPTDTDTDTPCVPPDVDAIRAWLTAHPAPEPRPLSAVEEFQALALHRRRSACFRSRYDRRRRSGVENPGRAA